LFQLLPLLAPLALLAAAAAAFSGPGFRPRAALRAAEAASLVAFVAALLCAVALVAGGPWTGPTLGFEAVGLASRVDVVSVTMLLLVTAVGWAVLRYSATYLDGEARQGPFTGWMCLTLGAVLLLVQAGSLAQLVLGWVATSLFLHRLLLFRADRVAARRAARKKYVTARLADAALVGAAALLVAGYGTGDVAAILEAARAGEAPAAALWAAGLLALAALLKSAQFPTHGWLTEVMETPTPVSALLHAGVINAGGFLLIRFADVMLLAPGVLAVVATMGASRRCSAGS
jgi:NAD(P)H-quinone oxidoreductase subunit 5